MKTSVISTLFLGVILVAGRSAVAAETLRFFSDDAVMKVSAQLTCDACGPGPMWMDGCLEGDDVLDSSGAEIGIFPVGDPTCSGSPANFVLFGSVTVHRNDSSGTQIDTEITTMELAGAWATLVVGPGPGNGIVQRTFGTIVEQPGDNTLADSNFQVFFEANLGGFGTFWNHDPLSIDSVIECVPPDAEYTHPASQCIPLYDDPNDGQGVIVAYLGNAQHDTVTEISIPTLSEWAAIGMTLLLLVAGTIVFFRKRGREAAVA